ncbi:MAG: HNH endonuclease [Clostridia bacterium]|nr:HNH endonuclease [Clostridia bacterium]
MDKIWKPMLYKNEYLGDRFTISSDGDIYSLKSKKVLKQKLNKTTGYYALCVSLGSRENKKYLKTHIAVASTFLDCSDYSLVVNHKDGDKTNNNVSNLEWVTQKENMAHASEHGLFNVHKGSDVYNSKLSSDDVRQIRKMLADGMKQSYIATFFSVSCDVIYHIAHNHTYQDVV